MRKTTIASLSFGLVLGLTPPAYGAPPPGTDPSSPLSQWFQRQHNINGRSCCGVADGHIIDEDDVRTKDGHWEIRVSGEWYQVPQGHSPVTADMAQGDPNPTGHAVAWYLQTTTPNADGSRDVTIYCFAPPTGL